MAEQQFKIGDRVWYCGEGEGGPEFPGVVNRAEPDPDDGFAYWVTWDDGAEGMIDGYSDLELARVGQTWGDIYPNGTYRQPFL